VKCNLLFKILKNEKNRNILILPNSKPDI